MRLKSRKHYAARARIAKALAHPSRLLMLDALHRREACVGELTEIVGADQSTVSKHLALLRDAGLVVDRKEGARSYYSLRCSCLEGFWSCLETVLADRLKDQQAVLR